MKRSANQIRSERLVLNRLEPKDAPLALAVWNDPDFIRFVGDREIRDLDQALEAMEKGGLKLWEDLGYGPFVVSLADGTGQMGICGLFKRENLEDPDIGYGFLPQFCGRGYALEAARAIRDHARDHMGLERICAIVSPGHPRSIRLLEKLGMTCERTIRMPDEDEDILLYGMNLV